MTSAAATSWSERRPAPRRRLFEGLSRGLFIRPLCVLALVGLLMGFILPPRGVQITTCGMLEAMGTPCPGCGLTRSVTCFLQGEFAWSFHYHPLGWGFALAFAAMGALAPLPTRWRDKAIARISRYDTWIGWTLIAYATLLVGYGIFRAFLVQTGAPEHQWWRSSADPPWLNEPAATAPAVVDSPVDAAGTTN